MEIETPESVREISEKIEAIAAATPEKGFYVKVYCPDCMGDSDTLGCFGGGFSEPEGPFKTPEAAAEYGFKETHRTVWDFVLVDETGAEVEIPDIPYTV